MLGGPPNRRGEAPTRDFHLRLRFPVPFNGADIYSGLTHVVLTSMRKIGAKGSSGDPTRRSMQTAGYGLLRMYLPRTP